MQQKQNPNVFFFSFLFIYEIIYMELLNVYVFNMKTENLLGQIIECTSLWPITNQTNNNNTEKII